MLGIMFRKEMKMVVSSRRFLYSLILLFLPVGVGAWYCHAMWLDPSILSRMTGGWLTHVTPMVCTMVYLDVAPLPIALIAIIFSSDFIAGEEERGTLLLLLSKPVSRFQIILAKYLSFLLVFLLLVGLNLFFFSLSLKVLGIGMLQSKVFFSYMLALLCTGIVYTSLGTLFSVAMGKTLAAILAGFVLLITWYIFDWMISYLPLSVSQVLEKFSLSYYINELVGYASRGEASLFVAGGLPEVVSFRNFAISLLVILGGLTVLPIAASMVILERKDIQGS